MALKISNRSNFTPFVVLEVMAQAFEIEAKLGEPVMRLVAGQPSTPAPKPARQAIVDALEEPDSHGYTVTPGLPQLRKGIAEHYRRVDGLDVDADSIIATVGSSLGFRMAFTVCFDAGDVVAITNPGYTAYRNLMVAAGLKPLLVQRRLEEGWRINRSHLEALETVPDGLLIASPTNPTGVVLSRDEMKGVVEWCAENGVRLISDEIYHGITFGDKATSALEFTSDAVVINSFSKFFSMTGHRIGWMVLPKDLLEPITRLAQNMYISVPTLSQIAATAAITDPAAIAELESHVERYRRNRDFILKELDPRLLNTAPAPDGAFYLYLDSSRVYPDSREMTQRLIDEVRVAISSGVDFDPDNGDKAIRLSYAGGEEEVAEAVRRINDWVKANAKG